MKQWRREATDREEHTKRATRYFRRALRYSATGSKPSILVVMGRIGTGKSTVAKQLASELDWPVFSSDEIRKTLAGVPLNVRTAPQLRDKVQSDQMTDRTYKKLLENGLAALATHSGVVFDATFSSCRKREHGFDSSIGRGLATQWRGENGFPGTIACGNDSPVHDRRIDADAALRHPYHRLSLRCFELKLGLGDFSDDNL